MDPETPRKASSERGAQRQPEKQAEALVHCKGFRCAAYQDKDGVWRSAIDGQKLEVLEILVRF